MKLVAEAINNLSQEELAQFESRWKLYNYRIHAYVD